MGEIALELLRHPRTRRLFEEGYAIVKLNDKFAELRKRLDGNAVRTQQVRKETPP